jgi:hypothetical protein
MTKGSAYRSPGVEKSRFSLDTSDGAAAFFLHLAAVAGVIWLLFLIFPTFVDYFTRGWVPLNH